MEITGGVLHGGSPRRTASGISTDTRTLKPGRGFVALKGARFDGNRFIAEAVKKGAAWVVMERGARPGGFSGSAALIEVPDTLEALGLLAADHRRRFKLKVAAITGSVGKSTTKEMTAALLGSLGKTLKNQGNFNNRIGLPLTLFKLDRSYDGAVLEMGCNQPGEIRKLSFITRPDAGLITRIGPVHLEGLGSIAGVARAKSELIRELGARSSFVLNLDDPLIVQKSRGFRGNVIAYSARPEARFPGRSFHLVGREKEVIAGRPAIRFSIQQKIAGRNRGRPVEFRLMTLSGHNVRNALAACALASVFGVSLPAAAEALRSFKGLSGRGEVKKARRGYFVIDDSYNASPPAVDDALETLLWWKGPRRGVVALGEMRELGRSAEKYHRELGRRIALAGIELLVATGELGELVAAAARESGMDKKSALAVRDNERAAKILKRELKKGDWVLVKGSRATKMDAVARALME